MVRSPLKAHFLIRPPCEEVTTCLGGSPQRAKCLTAVGTGAKLRWQLDAGDRTPKTSVGNILKQGMRDQVRRS